MDKRSMFDTMTVTKAAAGLFSAWLVLLLGKWAAEEIYHVDGHGEASYVIETDTGDSGGDVADDVDLGTLLASADIEKGARVFRKCSACHKMEDGANGTGPYLYGVVGRPVASAAGFGYSSAMQAHGGDWTAEELDAFLLKPSADVPGTSMSFAGLKKQSDRVDLIAYLNSQSASPIVFEASASGDDAASDEAATDGDAPAAEEGDAPAAEDSAAPAAEETDAPAAEDSTAPAAGEGDAPAADDSAAPAAVDSAAPAAEDSAAPADDGDASSTDDGDSKTDN